MLNWKTACRTILFSAILANAHLIANSLTPKGGQTIVVGQPVSIAWSVKEVHSEGIDIALSKDGGKTWTDFKKGYNVEDTGATVFRWTFPAGDVTTQGKIRICQSGPCDNGDSVSSPGNRAPWTLISGKFTIQTATSIATPAASSRRLSVAFNSATRNVDASFALAGKETILLQAFDTQGRVVATLLQGEYAAGDHAVSVFSNRLTNAAGTLVFKLQAGNEIQTHTWMQLR